MKPEQKKILVMRYRFIGDTILTIPFLRNLRRAEPDAYIAWMVAPGSSDIIKNIPYVDELIYWDPVTIHADSKGIHRTLSSKYAFIQSLRKKQFDKVYVLKRSLSSAIIAFLTGAPERIGFDTEARGCLLTRRVPYRHDQHEVQNFLDVLRTDGITVKDAFLELWIEPQETAVIHDLLVGQGVDNQKKIVALHPFSAVVERGWPIENFAHVASVLEGEGYVPVILGGKKDVPSFQNIKNVFPSAVIDCVGKLTLRETAALLKRSSFFLGNDSGIMHIAAAIGVPLVAIFGPQSPVKFGPWSAHATALYKHFPCSPCRQKFFRECKPSERFRPFCIEEITVEDVMRELKTRLNVYAHK
ncbi:MAG: lipopolysaccharide heptosyltransferase II [Nitrospirota bacterium]